MAKKKLSCNKVNKQINYIDSILCLVSVDFSSIVHCTPTFNRWEQLHIFLVQFFYADLIWLKINHNKRAIFFIRNSLNEINEKKEEIIELDFLLRQYVNKWKSISIIQVQSQTLVCNLISIGDEYRTINQYLLCNFHYNLMDGSMMHSFMLNICCCCCCCFHLLALTFIMIE